jgi:hypothetical protein
MTPGGTSVPPSAPASSAPRPPPPAAARPHDPGRTCAHEQQPADPPMPHHGRPAVPGKPPPRPRQPAPRRTAMTLTINDDSISGDHTRHTARPAPGRRHAWEISWLPGRLVDRNTAITAMVLADTAGSCGLRARHRLRPHIQSWAGELGLAAPDALARASRPPGCGLSSGPTGWRSSATPKPHLRPPSRSALLAKWPTVRWSWSRASVLPAGCSVPGRDLRILETTLTNTFAHDAVAAPAFTADAQRRMTARPSGGGLHGSG